MSTDRSWSTGELEIDGGSFQIHRLAAVEEQGLGRVDRLPRCLRILLENLLRHEDGDTVSRDDIAALASWQPNAPRETEIAFRPARVLLQDFTGVPAVVDLAVMRDAMAEAGGDPGRINPLRPADLVIDHSVQVDVFGQSGALRRNVEIEYRRNRERYAFLRWGQGAFRDFRVVPPGTGIVHQVNLEYLAPVVFDEEGEGGRLAFPDTLVGTDSHTTMINGLGVVGWGVGGIEAEAALLGQPISMLVPDVVGMRLHGSLPEGVTATDLVLTVTQRLREHGVVGKFVEFFGPGLRTLSLADRATVANMCPEYGATVGFFPIDDKTLDYLRLTGRDDSRIRLVEAYARAQGLFETDGPDPEYTSVLELDLGEVESSLAGPRRPQDRVPLRGAGEAFRNQLRNMLRDRLDGADAEAIDRWVSKGDQAFDAKRLGAIADAAPVRSRDVDFELRHGHVVIAAITSCTNTSNPSVLVAAGLLARNAVERGLQTRPWVKTSLAPGSRVVSDYLARAGLLDPLEKLGFHLVGYGCTTCIGNSGPLPEPIAGGVQSADLVVTSVLSGNRNFEGRINPHVRANYLASPPLVVAYALSGRMDVDLRADPLGTDADGSPVYLRDIWPSSADVQRVVNDAVKPEMYRDRYGRVFEGDAQWSGLPVPEGNRFAWDPASTYVLKAPYFEDMRSEPEPVRDVQGARVLALLGDSVTTDHISPAGSIPADGPAGRYLIERGVEPKDFNSFGSRRGNHEVMVRGTFANIRLRNLLAPGTEGGFTRYLLDGGVTTIYEAAMRYAEAGVPLVVIAGKEYGTGSSRDWAAKGTRLLGVRAVLAEGYERIHRSNLIGMGVLPLEFARGEGASSLGLSGLETYDVEGIESGLAPGGELTVRAHGEGGEQKEFRVRVRIDTPVELEYYRHGGILPYVLRSML
jgi:aconitate hydratase